MPGVMTWEEMNWLLPDFDETGLIYHGGQLENLARIFQEGLIPQYTVVQEMVMALSTILTTGTGPNPFQTGWIRGRCIFGFMNRARQGGSGGIVEWQRSMA